MEDRVCLVTDGASAAGHALAVSLAKMDAAVVVVARDAAAGAAVRGRIAEDSGSARVEALVGELATRDGVFELAADFLAAHDRLDVLVNNARGRAVVRELTVDGYESTFAINQLAPFQLTRLLMEQLRPAETMRVVNVVDAPADRLDLANLNADHRYDAAEAGAATALMNVLFTHELARRMEGTPVTVNCVRARGGWWSARRAAEGPLYLATSPCVEGVTGQYFEGMRQARAPAAAYDAGLARQLWNRCAQTTPVRPKVSEGFFAAAVAEVL